MNRYPAQKTPHLMLAIAVLFAATAAIADAQPQTPPPSPTQENAMFRAVVHINFGDQERQGHGLKNIRNMLQEVGQEAAIEVVCHGAGIALLHKDKSAHAAEVAKLQEQGVRFLGCENTMRDKSISKAQLLAGVDTVPSGAVEVIRRQQQGYGYFRP